ncbi:MAG: response regulator transcription factor [Atopobiaceae bacterium]|jgi:DNA-binding response OmpR family regulator|nr:response regulator transcription factor [Atopobiaceae bacterium]MCH4180058.1 response regulator transcription factor [Atopobiaceae bacterium]MCH4213890.1 response regulator transcription factor [Atopobiaceae bacterium]MCH4230128.1 response regulator transcription factor [Atopobiaceae bacterium]MCH4275647.1 response regulator transcription factor [Atopobiaceae bacterium]
MNVLVVEDERNLADAICHILKEDGYNAEAAYDGKTGLSYAQSGMYDAVVLDVMLPGIDGFEVVHTLRKENNSIPVMMLTARTATTDKVEGLDCGADDYMTKPFESAELLARVRALTRRQGEVVVDEASFGDLTLDLNTHDLKCDEHHVHLSQKEFEVLRMLMSGTNRVVSKQDLLTRVWGTEGETNENSAEAYISFLRKKLTFLHSRVQITTLRMLGYRLEELDQ